MLNWALKYLGLGFSVIPLAPRSKTPLLDWKPYQSRRASESEIREWFTQRPDANLGVVTGAISRICVADLDGPEGLQQAQNLGLSSMTQSLTGNGKHLWYRNPIVPVQNAVRIYPGIDVRGQNGYVVVPPSVHESGRRYRFLRPLNIKELQEFPKELLKMESSSDTSKATVGKPEGWIAKALEEMKDGNIDNTLTSILGRLRRDGYSSGDARILLDPHARAAGAEEGHLEAKIKNIWNRYPSQQRDEAKPINSSRNVERRWELPSGSQNSGLVIHSPTNPDSIKQFEQLSLARTGCDGERLSTGYARLDAMLQGGLKSSRLFTLAARTGVGKTNWLLGAVKSLCRAGKVVLLFSTEMPYAQIWERYIATLEDPESFKEHKFYVCDSFAPNLEKVEEAINAIKPDVFMFDHINHVSEEVKGLGEFMQGLNYLRRKYDTAGIVTAQLNRAADWVDLKTGEKVTPRMSMIKGSGTIEQASSRVLLLSETRVTPEGTEIVGNLDKNDNGDKGLLHFMLTRNPYRMIEL